MTQGEPERDARAEVTVRVSNVKRATVPISITTDLDLCAAKLLREALDRFIREHEKEDPTP